MATNNNYKGNNNTGKKAPTPRISAKIDNLVDNNTNLRAFASITLFVSMPSYSYEDHNGETKYADYAHPISKEARDAINTKVLDAYEQALEESETENEGEGYGESEDYDSEPDEAPSFRPRM